MNPTPLLSVLVPTYQRASLLRVMLQSLLPQAADCNAAVEICIADNASNDDTAAVVAEACAAHSRAMVSYVRREQNEGPVRNYVRCATEQATGQFIWALGDDDLLVAGALQRICSTIRAHPQVRFFYVNFACANFREHWPLTAHGGYDGAIVELACAFIEDRPVRYWQELLDRSSSMGTQVYAHIAPRDVWTRYWDGRTIAPDYRSLESTYPHTCMLIEMAWDQPAMYLGTPAVVQFNGRAGWADGQGARIALVSLPKLIARLDDKGLGFHAYIRARAYLRETVLPFYRDAIAGRGGPDAPGILADSLSMSDRYPDLVDALLAAIQETGRLVVPEVIDVVRSALLTAQSRRAR
jgi:glycosyltransferase involved in cell wall biosynthesis